MGWNEVEKRTSRKEIDYEEREMKQYKNKIKTTKE